jgi:HTH-type transcriptional regulator, competence development regulator
MKELAMKLNLSNEWLAKRAVEEEGHEVSAGHLDVDKLFAETKAVETTNIQLVPSELEGPRTAFGRLINLCRRRKGIRLDQLAKTADVDLAELVTIEQDVRYIPEPRTVYQLAKTFDLPNDRLLQLSGNVVARDSHLGQEAVRFAARADSVDKLSKDEQQALEEFVKYLSEDH